MPPLVCGRPCQDGSPCNVPVTTDGVACLWHDPERRDQAQAARKRGGKKSSAGRSTVRTVAPEDTPGEPPETVEDAIRWASWAVAKVATGQLDARTGHEIGFLLRAFMDGRKVLDKTDERVKTLREQLDKLRKEVSS